MPRAQRPDIQPVILVEDLREAQRRLDDYRLGQYKAYGKTRRSEFVPSITLTDIGLKEVMKLCQASPALDLHVFMAMVKHCDRAKDAPIYTKDGKHQREGELLRRKLVRVGCRVRLTQQQIADECRCCRDHVINQIRIMKEADFIVNWGKGWYEFSCLYVWRGPAPLRFAYMDVQRMRRNHDKAS